jgi:MFS family permease
LALLRRPQFLAPTAVIALSNMAMYVTLIAIPLLLAARGDVGEAATGAILGTAFLTAVGLSPVGGRLSDRSGRRLPAVGGLVVQAGAIAVLAISPADIPPAAMLAALIAMGAGVGLSAAPVQVAALEAVHAGSSGIAAGIYSTSRYLGSIIGTSLFAGPLVPGPGEDGFGVVFAVMALAAVSGSLIALLLPGRVPAPGLPAEAPGPPATELLPE